MEKEKRREDAMAPPREPEGELALGERVEGNRTGQACPQCGCDCWWVRYVEQPGGVVCFCSCGVCSHLAQKDGRAVPHIVLTEYPGEATSVALPPQEIK